MLVKGAPAVNLKYFCRNCHPVKFHIDACRKLCDLFLNNPVKTVYIHISYMIIVLCRTNYFEHRLRFIKNSFGHSFTNEKVQWWFSNINKIENASPNQLFQISNILLISCVKCLCTLWFVLKIFEGFAYPVTGLRPIFNSLAHGRCGDVFF